MSKLSSKKNVNAIIFLFAATYMVSYITRTNYGAVVSEMQAATGFSKSLLSISLTASFITYGAGQIVSGAFGDRISPKKLVLWGLLATVVMNFLIPLCNHPYQMIAVWALNGFAQSFMWPPMVKILTGVLSEEEYKNAITKVSWGSSIGTIVVYLASPLLISAMGWKSVFLFAAGLGVVMIFAWNSYAYDVKPEQKTYQVEKGKTNGLVTPFFLCVMVVIMLQGMLRDGVTTWMPSYIAETYNLSNQVSILAGGILPVFSILCFQIATKMYTGGVRNLLSCAGLFFGVGALSAMGLGIFAGQGAGVSVAMFAVLIGCMNGANLMLVCMLPPYFRKTGKISTVSGILNSCTYVGSAISTYGIAVVSDGFGWDVTIQIWLAVAVCAAVICFVWANAGRGKTRMVHRYL